MEDTTLENRTLMELQLLKNKLGQILQSQQVVAGPAYRLWYEAFYDTLITAGYLPDEEITWCNAAYQRFSTADCTYQVDVALSYPCSTNAAVSFSDGIIALKIGESFAGLVPAKGISKLIDAASRYVQRRILNNQVAIERVIEVYFNAKHLPAQEEPFSGQVN